MYELIENTTNYYDREGSPLEVSEWSRLVNDDPNYKIVKQEYVGDYFVSTVWIGLNMNILKGHKLIFETMIFPKDKKAFSKDDPILVYQNRYATEQQALEGHEEAVQMVRKRIEEI